VKLVKGEGRATHARALARLAEPGRGRGRGRGRGVACRVVACRVMAWRGVSCRDRDRDVIHVNHNLLY
jgi:hypothetical protein